MNIYWFAHWTKGVYKLGKVVQENIAPNPNFT